ncbi:MAG TPA: hypothetical protein VFM18_00145 [Methanosarcina sp.]|nr:hypothetical protein [Methanosarcina sp.]
MQAYFKKGLIASLFKKGLSENDFYDIVGVINRRNGFGTTLATLALKKGDHLNRTSGIKNLMRFLLSSFDSGNRKKEVIQVFRNFCQGWRFDLIHFYFKPQFELFHPSELFSASYFSHFLKTMRSGFS